MYTYAFLNARTLAFCCQTGEMEGIREPGEPGEDHRHLIGYSYLVTCPGPDSNPVRRGQCVIHNANHAPKFD